MCAVRGGAPRARNRPRRRAVWYPPISTPMVRRAGMPSLYAQMPSDLRRTPVQALPRRPARAEGASARRGGPRPGARSSPGRPRREAGPRKPPAIGGGLTWKRGLLYLVLAVVGWLLLSLVLFIVSAQIERGKRAELGQGGVDVGREHAVLDRHRADPRHRPASRRDRRSRAPTPATPAAARTRSCCGGSAAGSSRRLSIPRDTARHDSRARRDQDQRCLRVRRAGAGDQDRRAVHRRQDQPRDHRQPRRLSRSSSTRSAGSTSRPAASARRSAAAPRTAASRSISGPAPITSTGLEALTSTPGPARTGATRPTTT